MKQWPLTCAAIFTLLLSACDQAVVQSVTSEPQAEEDAKALASEPSSKREPNPDLEPAPEPGTESASEAMHPSDYTVLTAPWNKYFRGTPKILLIDRPSKGILDLLEEEQKLIKAVLDTTGKSTESSEYAALEEQLAELKTLIPSAETASGYVPGSSRAYTYSYVVGGTVYTRTQRYYDGYYYRAFLEKQKSSSPELVRSVEGIVHNATLEPKDLDQRIEALQRLTSQWNRRTSEMSPTGTSGIIREANEAYLVALRDFIKEVIKLRSQVRQIESQQQIMEQNKASILTEWKGFEDDRLQILNDYLNSNALAVIEAKGENVYSLPVLSKDQRLIYVCTIGARDLYFELSSGRSNQHPFVLVDVSPL